MTAEWWIDAWSRVKPFGSKLFRRMRFTLSTLEIYHQTHFFQIIQFTREAQFGTNHALILVLFQISIICSVSVRLPFLFPTETRTWIIKPEPLADSQRYDLPRVVRKIHAHVWLMLRRVVRVYHISLCVFLLWVCVSRLWVRFLSNLAWMSSLISAVFFVVVCTSWWTDRKCFGALNMKPWPWAQSVHYSLCFAANHRLFCDLGFGFSPISMMD